MGDPRDLLDSWNRKWRTLWCWSQLYIGYKAAQAKGRLLSEKKRDEFWEKKHSYLAEMAWTNIAELRGWWVKVGQFLSTRSDLLPAQYITYLTKLQDMMPTSEFSVVKTIVEEELGRPLSEIFESFEEKALASASIAQVHRAKLRETGLDVVVKVQHPGVDRTLRQDMLTLTQMSWAFGMLEKGLNVGPILEEWQKSASDELDFRVELRNQMRARHAVERSGVDVIVPKCYPELTTKRVLVMDYCDGFKITDTEKLRSNNVNTNVLMEKICRSFAHQIHVDGMFNGDPHPGNILVHIDPNSKNATPVLLDWGLVKSFSAAERTAFAKAVYCVANADVMGLMAAFEDMGFHFKSNSVIDPEVYMDALRVGFFRDSGEDTFAENKSTLTAARSAGVTRKNLIDKNPIDDWPKDIIFFIRVASLLHGLCLQLEARVPFLGLLVDRAEQCLQERYSPESPLVYVQYPPLSKGRLRSRLEWAIFRFLLHLLYEKQLILGCQVAIFKNNKQIVDLSVGQMGPVDTRPVQRSTLFPLMALSNGILATAVLKLFSSDDTQNLNDASSPHHTTSSSASLDDPVCHWWDGFIRFGKDKITIRDVLSHRAGLHAILPHDLTLSALSQCETMISLLEDAAPKRPFGAEGGRYAYMTSGWVFSEIVRGVTGERIDKFVHKEFIRRLGCSNELFFPIPETYLGTVKTTAETKVQTAPPAGSATSCSPPTVNDKTHFHFNNRKSVSPSPLPSFRQERYVLDDIASPLYVKAESSEHPQSRRKSLSSSSYTSSSVSPTCAVKTEVVPPSGEEKLITSPTRSRQCLSTKKTEKELESRNTLLLRLSSTSRALGVTKIDAQEVQKKIRKAQQAASLQNQNQHYTELPSKYIHRVVKKPEEPKKGVTAIELAKEKPHVLDPLIYDSRRLLSTLIPPMNGRSTARALALFYAALAGGQLIDFSVLYKASEIATVDDTLDTLILTGGGARLFGLGYQLYPALCLSDEINDVKATGDTKQQTTLFPPSYLQGKNREKSQRQRVVRGLGHGDMGGSVALCYPELKLSIVILLNDFLTGPETSKQILSFILRCFKLKPLWDVPYSLEILLHDVHHTLVPAAQKLIPTTHSIVAQESQYAATLVHPQRP